MSSYVDNSLVNPYEKQSWIFEKFMQLVSRRNSIGKEEKPNELSKDQ